jgi:uncharacterized protein
MSEQRPAVLYLHGFNSSPDSRKAQQFKRFCETHTAADVLLPALPQHPAEAMLLLRDLVAQRAPALVVGSSLGGFYATLLAEAFGLKAVLLNPAVKPAERLDSGFLRVHTNPYTGETWEFTQAHAEALRTLTLPRISRPELYLLLLQSADEVLDYRHAVDYYSGCRQRVQQGGSHAFDNFTDVLPDIVAFGDVAQSRS